MTTTSTPVGYKKPPVTSRFKAGQSGNPSGRPKKAKSLALELVDELGESASATPNITNARAIAKTLVRAAIEGNLRAIAILASSFGKQSAGEEESAELLTDADAKVLDSFVEGEIRRRDLRGSTSNDFSPTEKQ
jgi:Family of unknown function (DUF5681)